MTVLLPFRRSFDRPYSSEGGRLAEVGYRMITGSMDTISTANNAKVMEIVDTGRRRRFSIEAKQRIVEESYCCGDPVSVVARRHGLFPGQLFGWRRLARQGTLAALNAKDGDYGFVAALIEPEPTRSEGSRDDARCEQTVGRMEIVLGSGVRLIVGVDVDTAALSRVLRVLEGR
ncbi:IS66-like element accessory protein TnpA [Bradyrhizobium sp. USDA 10063]